MLVTKHGCGHRRLGGKDAACAGYWQASPPLDVSLRLPGVMTAQLPGCDEGQCCYWRWACLAIASARAATWLNGRHCCAS